MAAPSVRLHPEAIAEAKAAYEWYAERNPAAANAFISELDDAISQIHTGPERWPVHLHDTRKFLHRGTQGAEKKLRTLRVSAVNFCPLISDCCPLISVT